jgi:hypothetical protein
MLRSRIEKSIAPNRIGEKAVKSGVNYSRVLNKGMFGLFRNCGVPGAAGDE